MSGCEQNDNFNVAQWQEGFILQNPIRLRIDICFFQMLVFVFMQTESCAEFFFQPGQRGYVRLVGMGDQPLFQRKAHFVD